MISLKDFKLLLKTYSLGSSSDRKYLNKCIIVIVFSGISDGLFLLFGTKFLISPLLVPQGHPLGNGELGGKASL